MMKEREKKKTKDVDGGWAWVVLMASFMNMLLASGMGYVSGMLQKLFLEQFGESVAFTAWVTGLFSALMQLAGPLSGFVASVSSCRVTVMVGGVLLASGLAASSFATSLHFLFVSYGLVAGTGLGLMYSPSIVIVNFFFERRRTLVMGVALSASGIGITGYPVLSRFLFDQFSWREALMIIAAINAHVCVFGAVMFPVHERSSACLRLCRRCRGRPQPPKHLHHRDSNFPQPPQNLHRNSGLTQSPQHLHQNPRNQRNHNAESGSGENIAEGQSLFCDQGTSVSGMNVLINSSLSKLKPDSDASPGFDGTIRNYSVSKTDRISGEVDDEVNDDVDDSAERTVLLEKTKNQDTTNSQTPIRKLALDENVESLGNPEPCALNHHHRFESRKHENKTDHSLKGSKPAQSLLISDRGLSHSSHEVHKLHKGHPAHHALKNLARSLVNVRVEGDPRGMRSSNRLDMRAISTYSSIQSLHSLGLPTARELLAQSPPDSEAAAADELVGDAVVENVSGGGGSSGGGDGDVGGSGGDGAGDDGGGGKGRWAIVKNVMFLFLCLNLFLSNMSIAIFTIHLPAFSQPRGLIDSDVAFVLAMLGLTVFVSRILMGVLGHDEQVDKLAVYFGLHLCASVVQASLPLSKDLVGVTMLAVLMGVYYGSVYSLLTSLTISIVGLSALAFAFGVEMIFAGLGYLVAPPLAGWIVDETGDYNNSMYLGGLLMFVSALCLLCLTCGRDPSTPPIGYRPLAPVCSPALEVQIHEDGQDSVEEHTV